MKKLGILGIVGCALMLVGFSGCRKHTPEKKAEWAVKYVTKKLDLNEEQQAKLNDVKVTWLELKKKYAKDKEANYEEVKALIRSESLDENRVRGLIDDHKKKVDLEFPAVFKKVQAFHATLSKEQKEKAVELMDKFHKRSCSRH